VYTGDANGTALPTVSFSGGPVVFQSTKVEDQLGGGLDALGNPTPCIPRLPLPLVDCTRLKGFTSRLQFAAVGSGTVQISYPGDLAYDTVTRSFPVTVTRGAVTLRLSAVQEGTATERQVRLLASLTAFVQQYPTGVVQFFDGPTLLQTNTVGRPVSGDTLVTSALVPVPAAGLRTYRIVYPGDANWLPAEAQVSINVQ
jgi:hypothetical protein